MKKERQTAILSIIREEPIETQGQLLNRLRERGFLVTQATVSRDIKELGLVKVKVQGGRDRYTLPHAHSMADGEARLRRAFGDYVVELIPCGDFIVVKTLPGAAQTVAVLLDGMDWPELVGTIGGDDTILVLVRNEKPVSPLVGEVLARLEELR